MIITKTIEDAPILVPNVEHKNFTESNEIIPKGTTVKGNFKNISGLRRGKPFDYRVFITEEEEIIYSKNIKPMETREVTLGADSQVTSTKIEIIPAEKLTKNYNVLGSAIGGVLGFAIAKKMKAPMGKTVLFATAGVIVGLLVAKQIKPKSGIVIQKAK